jgi:ERCC4-type nuclease
MEIHVDDRERAIIPYLEDVSQATHVNYVIKRMTIGDYAIVYNGNILVVIERKTLVDLASSLRDGRSKNVEKLINLRQTNACKIIYIIEGPLVKDDRLFARIPYKALQAHIDHLTIRDDIFIINTHDLEHTANRIFALAVNYMTIKPSLLPTIESKSSDELTASQTSCISINEQILRCLPGVGCLIGTILSENAVTLQSLYLQQHSVDLIARLKYASGGAIGLAKAEKIINIYKIIDSQSMVNKKIHLRILSTIPLISKSTAEKILSVISLADILNNNSSIDILSKIERSEKNKLGQKAASNIISYLTPMLAPPMLAPPILAPPILAPPILAPSMPPMLTPPTPTSTPMLAPTMPPTSIQPMLAPPMPAPTPTHILEKRQIIKKKPIVKIQLEEINH